MDQQTYNSIVNFIWSVADDVLRDVYVRGKYRDIILPLTVIRRLDALLEPTKESVIKMKKQLDDAGIVSQAPALRNAAGQAFYNTSPFTLRDLKSRSKQQQLKADFEAYLDGFSSNVQDILDRFEFRNQIPKMVKADILGSVIEKFLDPSVNLSPKPVLNSDGSERSSGLDNHAMGTIFEELIRRFNEENNEEAGEHFTPRDVVMLMADLIFKPIADQIESGTYLVYDGACGTGGMLTVAEERLSQLAEDQGKEVAIHLFGQEINEETFAITKADLLIKGEGAEADNIICGSTLSGDAFPSKEFDFMLSNPPYGKSWKTDLERMGGKKELKDPRFVVQHGDNPDYTMIPRSSDAQMLFLVNKLQKMKHNTKLGSRIAQVHNGSALFTGDAGSGESNIRRWIIENDWLEAIIALPENIFYNTGIATYIWVLTNRKSAERKRKVQLIDASQWYERLGKNLGKKNCQLSKEHVDNICNLVVAPQATEQSKIFPNEAFGYWKVTVERPLRLSVDLSQEKLHQFAETALESKQRGLVPLVQKLADRLGAGPHLNYNQIIQKLCEVAKELSIKLPATGLKFFREQLAISDEAAAPVIKKIHRDQKAKADSLHGLFSLEIDGKTCVVEFEPDTSLRDTEQVPLLEEGGIATFTEREVLPFAPDAWIDQEKTEIGYEISFTRHFYKPVEMRSLAAIKTDIYTLEQETEGLLTQIVGETE